MLQKLRRLFRPEPPQFDGEHSKTWWATRDTAESSSAAPYWEHRTHPSRAAIAEEVAKLEGSSLLEVGVHAGPTMWAIAQRKKFERLAGTELSETVLDFTRGTLPAALGQPVELVQAAADSLPFPDNSFDIVCTCMVLVCIGPNDIERSLAEMLRVSRRYIVLGEPFSGEGPDRIDPYSNTSYWVRNYERLLGGRARLVLSKMLADEAKMGHLDSVLVFERLSNPPSPNGAKSA
jgi:SAM-dependent methyltransferase